ncbi:MAG: APC family permease [Sulfolobaceae archaeon]
MNLKKAVLSLKENYGQAMAVTAPLGSVVSTTTAAVSYVGEGVVFTTLLALLASALWIYTLTLYTKRLASAGGYYTYVYSAWKSKKLAFTEALIELFAFSLLNAVNAISIYLMINTAMKFYGANLNLLEEVIVILLGLLYPTIVSFLMNIRKLLGYIVTISATAEAVLLIFLFSFSITINNGINWKLFAPPMGAGISSIATALILVMVSIDGAGAATYLGEETRRPLENVSKGIWLALIIGGISILFGTYALVSLWNGSLYDLMNSDQPLIEEMIRFGILPLAIVLALAINSLLASNIGTTVGSARILFNLSREKAAPNIFKKVNRLGQPLHATITTGLIGGVACVISLSLMDPGKAFAELGAVSSILWISGRVLDSGGVPLLFRRLNLLKGFSNIIKYEILPIITTIINILGVILSVIGLTVFQSIVLSVIIVIGIVWYIIKARFGTPGVLVVDKNNELMTIDEYFVKFVNK